MAKRAPLAARFSGERSGSAWRGTRSASQPVGMPRGEDLPRVRVRDTRRTLTRVSKVIEWAMCSLLGVW